MGGPGLAESRPMLRRATLLTLLLPGIALGQTSLGTVTALVSTQGTSGQANRAECASTTSLSTWNLVTSITPVVANGDKWRLGAATTTNGCTTSGGLPAGIAQDVTATGATQSVTNVPVNAMATTAGVTCTAANDQAINLCVYYLPGGSTTGWQLAAQGTFNFQLAIPPKPTITGITPGDAQLGVNVVAGTVTATETATRSVTFTVACTPAGGGSAVTGGPGNSGTIVCSGLTNGTAYTATATGLSAAGNPGPVSDNAGIRHAAAVQRLLGSLQERRRRRDRGLRHRRRRRPRSRARAPRAARRPSEALVKAALLALALAVALPAAAQSPTLVVKESQRLGSFQVTISPFSPNIDSEFLNAANPPYATVFGTSRPLMVQGQFNMSAWITEFGTLDVGVGAGFWEAWGQGFYVGTDGAVVRGGTTSLMIIPVQVQASYRLEWFYERFNVPFEPYARFAIVDYIWSTSGQNGVSSWTNPSTLQAYRGFGRHLRLVGHPGGRAGPRLLRPRPGAPDGLRRGHQPDPARLRLHQVERERLRVEEQLATRSQLLGLEHRAAVRVLSPAFRPG